MLPLLLLLLLLLHPELQQPVAWGTGLSGMSCVVDFQDRIVLTETLFPTGACRLSASGLISCIHSYQILARTDETRK